MEVIELEGHPEVKLSKMPVAMLEVGDLFYELIQPFEEVHSEINVVTAVEANSVLNTYNLADKTTKQRYGLEDLKTQVYKILEGSVLQLTIHD